MPPKEQKKKEGGYTLLACTVIGVVLLAARSIRRSNRARQSAQIHHRHWVPLSDDELRAWQFTTLKARGSVAPPLNPSASTDPASPAETGTQVAAVVSGPSAATSKQVSKVGHGWKIQCNKIPCNELLPGELTTGGIISITGVFNRCFGILIGDDKMQQFLLLAFRSNKYLVVNQHESGSFQDETIKHGEIFEKPGVDFNLEIKFLVANDNARFMVEVHNNKELLVSRSVDKYFVNSFHKMSVIQSRYQNCQSYNPAPTVVKSIAYLEG